MNFRPSWRVPVPREGDYVEIFNSDDASFGGSGQLNPGVLSSRPEDCDGRENSLIMNVPPLGGTILRRTGPSSYVAPVPGERVVLPKKGSKKKHKRAKGKA